MVGEEYFFGLEEVTLGDVVFGVEEVFGVAEGVFLGEVGLDYELEDVTVSGAE